MNKKYIFFVTLSCLFALSNDAESMNQAEADKILKDNFEASVLTQNNLDIIKKAYPYIDGFLNYYNEAVQGSIGKNPHEVTIKTWARGSEKIVDKYQVIDVLIALKEEIYRNQSEINPTFPTPVVIKQYTVEK